MKSVLDNWLSEAVHLLEAGSCVLFKVRESLALVVMHEV